ncbi:MAG: glutamate 5-kinase [Spirochaetaceae bacterium 4572_59]|nr:MAG: glutamate 5-kinase [Spirochaetaceae bacterium 4572_59]
MLQQVLKNSRKVVIKIGSNTLSHNDGTINQDFFKDLAFQISELQKDGKQIVVVSSGARIAGLSTLGKWKRKEDMHYKQALCSIGQVELMDSYRRVLKEYGILIGQILLTGDDFSDTNRTLRIRNTLFTLLDEGVVPIINENDSVSVAEIVQEVKIGDNDNLAALTASLWNADLLLIMSDIDGVFDKDPGTCSDAKLLEVVRDSEKVLNSIEVGDTGSFGTGGIVTKIDAARKVNDYGIPMILLNGRKTGIISKIISGEETRGTVFLPNEK